MPTSSHNRKRVALGFAFLALLLALVWPLPPATPGVHAKTDRSGLYDLAKARMLARVVGHVRAHYVAPDRISPRRMAIAALERVQIEVPEVRLTIDPPGATSANADPRILARAVHVSVGESTREFTLEKVSDLYELNWKLMEIFEFLERNLPPQVDLEALEYAAVNGLLSTLDPHSVLLSPRVYRELQLSQKGRFGGLGISVGEVDGHLVIQQVMRDTPAAEAGLEIDDRIVQIGGESTIGMTLDEAVNLLRGEPGSEVTLWILRQGQPAKNARPFKLVRREIQLPSVEEDDLGDGIGWVHIRSFQESTDEDLMASLERLERTTGGLKGLILDLRDNPGGLLDKAIRVSDAFLQAGTIVTTVRDAGRERDESHATLADTRARLPLVVLVNRQSASASEIVAGALKRNDRALLMGQRTFGKGSVQVIYRIDEAALKLTVAQYLTPGDVSIQGVGIVPDIDLVSLRIPEMRTKPTSFDGRIDLRPVPETVGGESSLSAHLSSESTREDKPSIVLRLLEDSSTPTHRQRRGQHRTMDGAIKLARDMLVMAPSSDRKQALVQLASFFPRRQQEEDERLQMALDPLDVQWRAGNRIANGGKGLVNVTMSVRGRETGGAGGVVVEAGKPFELEVALKNTSKRPLARLHLELESSIPGLGGRELAFGWIEPGQTSTRTLHLTPPAGVNRAGDRLVGRLYSDGEALTPTAHLLLAVAPRPRPVFAHTVQVDDYEAPDPMGNGDGLIQRGERLFIDVWVTNIGAGDANSVLATLRNESGPDVFLHHGRQELGALDPGESRRARFELEVKAPMKARLVELGLEIVDTATGASTGLRSVELPIFPSEMPPRKARSGLAAFPNVSMPLHAGASRDTAHVAEAQPAAVVEIVGQAGEWLALRYADSRAGLDAADRVGWVPIDRVRIAESGGATRDGVEAILQSRPPILTLPAIPSFISERELPLEGVARFAGTGSKRRLIYIFRERDKVFFRSGDGTADDRDRPGIPRPADDGRGLVEIGFSTSIPLELGKNDITVVAREGDDSVTRTTFTVYRLQ